MKKTYNAFKKELSNFSFWGICSVITASAIFNTNNYSSAQEWNFVDSAGFTIAAPGSPCIAVSDAGAPYVVFSDSSYGAKATVMTFNGVTWVVVGTPGFSA